MFTENQYLVPGLTTARLRFRHLEAEDFSLCLPFFQHPLSHQYWSTDGKDAKTLCKEWFDKQRWRYTNNRGGAMAVIEKSSGALVGWCGLLVQDLDGQSDVEVGYSIMPEHWRKGLATEAARACLEAAFKRNLAESVISIIQVDNLPSRRVAEKNGMVIDRRTVYQGNPVWVYRILKESTAP